MLQVSGKISVKMDVDRIEKPCSSFHSYLIKKNGTTPHVLKETYGMEFSSLRNTNMKMTNQTKTIYHAIKRIKQKMRISVVDKGPI